MKKILDKRSIFIYKGGIPPSRGRAPSLINKREIDFVLNFSRPIFLRIPYKTTPRTNPPLMCHFFFEQYYPFLYVSSKINKRREEISHSFECRNRRGVWFKFFRLANKAFFIIVSKIVSKNIT